MIIKKLLKELIPPIFFRMSDRFQLKKNYSLHLIPISDALAAAGVL